MQEPVAPLSDMHWVIHFNMVLKEARERVKGSVHTFHPIAGRQRQAELWVRGQPGLHSEILPWKKGKERETETRELFLRSIRADYYICKILSILCINMTLRQWIGRHRMENILQYIWLIEDFTFLQYIETFHKVVQKRQFHIRKWVRAWEVAQQLWALEDPGLIPSSCTVTHNHLL